MRNRAKCRLCDSIIESFHSTDLVLCKCEEIYVDGGESLRCGANNWDNFLRIDDRDVCITPVIREKGEVSKASEVTQLSRSDLLDMLSNMIGNIERLPQHALEQPVNNYDLASALILINQILRATD